MLISTVPPGFSVSWAISGGDAAFVTPADANDLSNGQPASPVRIKWRSDQINTTSSGTVVLTGTFSQPISARLAALLEPEYSTAALIPAGVKIVASGKLSGTPVSLGGDSATVRTVLHPNNAVRRPWVFPAVTIDAIVVTIWNDKNGSTWATANELIDIGTVWVGEGADYALKEDFKGGVSGGTLQRKSHEDQNWPWAAKAGKSPDLNITPMSETEAIGPRTDQMDFDSLTYRMAKGNTIAIVMSYLSRPGNQGHKPPAVIDPTTISEQRLVRTFMIGGLGPQGISLNGNGDQFYVAPFSFSESPP